MKEPKVHYGWIVVFLGLLVTIGAHGFGRMSYTIILPAMKDGLGLNYTQLGLIGTGNLIGYLLMALVGGALAARWGSRRIISLSLALMGLTIILTGLARDFQSAFFLRLLTGLGHGGAYVPAMALGSAWFVMQRRGFATGIVSAGIGGGTMIASLIVPLTLKAYGVEGWRQAWFFLGGGVLFIALVAGLFIRSRPAEMGLRPVGAEATGNGGAAPPPASKALDWSLVYRKRKMWYLGLVYSLYGFSYIIYMTFFAAYLVKEMGWSPGAASGLWALVGGISIFCGVLWGGISDRLGRGRGAALVYFFLAVSYLIMALSKSGAGFYGSAVLFGLCAWSIPTSMAATAGDFVGPRLAPAGLGCVTLCVAAGQALGPWGGGYLADLTRSFTVPFILAAGVSLVGGLLALGLKPSPRPD
ncbi:MAG: MFS transporter [Deltaproteobacteria bacterium]|nr:MFS transporter [Deltaproteobacteria bacterium]